MDPTYPARIEFPTTEEERRHTTHLLDNLPPGWQITDRDGDSHRHAPHPHPDGTTAWQFAVGWDGHRGVYRNSGTTTQELVNYAPLTAGPQHLTQHELDNAPAGTIVKDRHGYTWRATELNYIHGTSISTLWRYGHMENGPDTYRNTIRLIDGPTDNPKIFGPFTPHTDTPPPEPRDPLAAFIAQQQNPGTRT